MFHSTLLENLFYTTVMAPLFLFSGHWNIESLSRVLKAQPSVVRKHIGFWVSQGLLKETIVDEYTLVSEQKLSRKGALIGKIHSILAHESTCI